MLYGIGCDLCSLSHLEKSLSSAHATAFVRRVYGPAEQAALGLCEASPAPLNAHRLASAAADFAAKEAFLKAAGTGLREPFSLRGSKPSGRKTVPRPTASADRPPHGWRSTGCAPGSP